MYPSQEATPLIRPQWGKAAVAYIREYGVGDFIGVSIPQILKIHMHYST